MTRDHVNKRWYRTHRAAGSYFILAMKPRCVKTREKLGGVWRRRFSLGSWSLHVLTVMWTSHTSPAPLCFISSRLLPGVSPLIEPVGCSQDNEDGPPPQSRVNTAGSACCIPPRAEATDGGPDVGMTTDSTCKWQSAQVQFHGHEGLGSHAPQVSSLICLCKVEAKTSHRQAPPSGLKLAIIFITFF